MKTILGLGVSIALAIACTAALPPSAQAGAEFDSLHCMKGKDANKVLGGPVDLFSFPTVPGCNVIRLAQLCIRTAVNGLDDPLGGPFAALGYACFKTKCPDTFPADLAIQTRFGASSVQVDVAKGTKLLCVPYDLVP